MHPQQLLANELAAVRGTELHLEAMRRRDSRARRGTRRTTIGGQLARLTRPRRRSMVRAGAAARSGLAPLP